MRKIVFGGLMLISLCQLNAQSAWKKREVAASDVVKQYLTKAHRQAAIYNGKEMMPYPNAFRNHPYFESNEPVKGLLSYDGIVYPDVLLRLDLYRNELILQTPDNLYGVVLLPEKVDYAELYEYHLFYYYQEEKRGAPNDGYYMLLHDGGCRVLEKHLRPIKESHAERTVEYSFEKILRFYVEKENEYHVVKSKRSVLKLFKSHKRELNQFIKQHNLNFKEEPGAAIVAVVKEYERLIQKP